jgi:hypothetical protein
MRHSVYIYDLITVCRSVIKLLHYMLISDVVLSLEFYNFLVQAKGLYTKYVMHILLW